MFNLVLCFMGNLWRKTGTGRNGVGFSWSSAAAELQRSSNNLVKAEITVFISVADTMGFGLVIFLTEKGKKKYFIMFLFQFGFK